ncbi:hypothetical protein [Fodinicola acaciae]|uniref:hypothetical protein n=1 Tax=Fodinicola acaciae TaxID=2681555 RepID=UPI0016525738|nr:hypothetical protein [Fodinicola acaciae]
MRRRTFLLSVVAASAALPALGTSAASATTTCAGLQLLSGPEFPIGAFWPPSMQPRFNSLDRFQEMKDAGFTFSFVGAGDSDDPAYVGSSLDFAARVGLKALVVNGPDRALQVADTYQSYQSFAGFRLSDEPGPDQFGSLANGLAAVRSKVPGLLPYINLYPQDGDGFRAYVQGFINTVRPVMLSYDSYPLFADGSDDPNYFSRWQIFRAIGLGSGLPTWHYIQSISYNGHRLPTAPELAWQINVNLAYGCKGIQYFCYWQPPNTNETFGPALIDYDGDRTALYDAAKAFNLGWLAPVGAELKPLVSEKVTHANESPLPAGTLGFTADPYVTGTSGSAVIVSRFRAVARGQRTRWLLLANRSHNAVARTNVAINTATVSSVSRFDPATRTYNPDSTTVSVSLDPGAAALYRLDASGEWLDPQLHLVLVGNGAVYHALQETAGGWDGPNELGDASRLVATAEVNAELHVVEIDGNTMYHRIRFIDGSWAPHNAFVTMSGISSVAAASVAGELHVALVTNRVVYHAIRHADGTWDGFNRLGDAADLIAIAEVDGELQVAEIDGNSIYHRVRSADRNWSSRNLLASLGSVTSVAATGAGRELILGIVAAGNLCYSVKHADGSWIFPTATGDVAAQVSVAMVGGEVAFIFTANDGLQQRIRHSDGGFGAVSAIATPVRPTALAATGRSPDPCA